MKKILRHLFHFLGGIKFAIGLIATAAGTVVVGTLLESKSGSHLLAERWTYGHPFFQILLSLFFINILFSALRRWPFRKKHIPFLLTHLGLLMVISGTMLKNRFGLQGQMSVWEGSGSSQVLIPHSYAIHLEGRDFSTDEPLCSPINLASLHPSLHFPFYFPDVKCKIIALASHAAEKHEGWIKDSAAYIFGFPPLPLENWDPSFPLPTGHSHLKAMGSSLRSWNLIALKTGHRQKAFREAYLNNLTLRVNQRGTDMETFEIPLKKALHDPYPYAEGMISTSLHLTDLASGEMPVLEMNWHHHNGKECESIVIPLKGPDALLVQSDPRKGWNSRFTADLVRPQHTLCIIEDLQGDVSLIAFDPYGRVHEELFLNGEFKSIHSYDQGFGGYGIQATIPFPTFPASREDKERASASSFATLFKEAAENAPSLAPPIEFFKQGCRLAQTDFPEAFCSFIETWKETPGIQFAPLIVPHPVEAAIQNLDWETVPSHDLQAILWVDRLFSQFEQDMNQGIPLRAVLEEHQWPLLSDFDRRLSEEKEQTALAILAEQVYTIVQHLPTIEIPTELSLSKQAALMASFFRMYGIDHNLQEPYEQDAQKEENFQSLETFWKSKSPLDHNMDQCSITFETSLTPRIVPEDPPPKLEDCRPGIVLEFEHRGMKQTAALTYDATGTGLKWPVLQGKFLVRFQPQIKELPYRIRLRQARQILYPESGQTYSYECDILVSESEQEVSQETLSMNQVYETWDGYRFYLSGVGTAESGMKRIQLAVNHDPAKYILTYPGACFVFVGILLLFWGPSRK